MVDVSCVNEVPSSADELVEDLVRDSFVALTGTTSLCATERESRREREEGREGERERLREGLRV